jgi:hypothetical protein
LDFPSWNFVLEIACDAVGYPPPVAWRETVRKLLKTGVLLFCRHQERATSEKDKDLAGCGCGQDLRADLKRRENSFWLSDPRSPQPRGG